LGRQIHKEKKTGMNPQLTVSVDEAFARSVGRNLKPSDIRELHLMYGIKGLQKRCEAVVRSYKSSYKVLGLKYRGQPCAIAGTSLDGRIWMVSTSGISKCVKLILAEYSKVLAFLSYGLPATTLFNTIDPLSVKTIRLLKRLGFSVEQERNSKYLRIEVQHGTR
jgi:hypothetical protein